MTNFTLVFTAVLLLNVAVTFRSSEYYKNYFRGSRSSIDASSRSSGEMNKMDDTHSNQEWQKLLRKYLPVYLLATLSDWLQGPYVYALYADYGYSQHDIAVLFVAGFGSSMIFGSFVGGMADWGGRKAFVLVFAVVYAMSCITKHFKDFNILMLGRLLGGIATSLLFSIFEAWLIRAHSDAKLKQYLGKSFSWAAYGNSIIAIVAGLLANKAAGLNAMKEVYPPVHIGGYLNPFDIALGALCLCAVSCLVLWDENYGEAGEASSGDAGRDSPKWYEGLKNAFVTTVRNKDILLCGFISSLFEGSMYIFVFMWTPALTEGSDQELPFGLIFSTFMVSCMAGSSLFSIESEQFKGEQLAIGVFAVAAFSMALIAVSSDQTLKFLAMNLFEVTVGMYWPIMGTLKGSIVPESKRAAIYNLYRIPLNFIVLFSLLTDLTPTQSFTLNALMLSVATALQYILMRRRETSSAADSSTVSSPTSSPVETVSLVSSPEKKDSEV